ncbi:MAG: relaxase [Pseudomonadota bacterium]
MILNGSQRGGALKLAAHLLNMVENDHVEVHEVSGFSTEDLTDACQEADAVAKGTRCQQFLFSLSLSPPETKRVRVDQFEAAIEKVEAKLGLSGQARMIVFHEKKSRRHAHVVWSRIDVGMMKAINLPFYKTRLREASKDLFLEHGWRLPDGLRDRTNRDPRNFTLNEWQQAKRQGKDAREIKRAFQEAWAVSETKSAFAHALEEKGYLLARGDRRGFVALDVHGEVYAVAKFTGLKAKQVREKLGDAKQLRSVDEAREHIAQTMQPALSRWQQELKAQNRKLKDQQQHDRRKMVERQRAERQRLKAKLEERHVRETQARQARFRKGLLGLWDQVRGEHRRIREQNELEAWEAHLRDQRQTDAVMFQHLDQRRTLQQRQNAERRIVTKCSEELSKDRDDFAALRNARGGMARNSLFFER